MVYANIDRFLIEIDNYFLGLNYSYDIFDLSATKERKMLVGLSGRIDSLIVSLADDTQSKRKAKSHFLRRVVAPKYWRSLRRDLEASKVRKQEEQVRKARGTP